MVSIARKNLFTEKLKLLISVGGVMFSTFLILILLGIYSGLTIQITEYINKTQAAIWVTEEGVTDMFHSSSLLPDSLKNQIERKIEGGKVYRLIARATELKVREEGILTTKRQREKAKEDEGILKAKVNLIGYDTATGIGGPWKIKAGKDVPGKNEIIIDEMLAKNKKIQLGDNVEIAGENFTVVGISQETNLIVQQMVFMNFEDAQDLFNFKGRVNYYLVSLDDPSRALEVKERIAQGVSKVSVKTKQEWANMSAEFINESFVPIIFIIVIIGFLVGTVVVGLTTYTATMEKIREYGILKAIGAKNVILYKIVIEQSLWTVLFGFIAGSILTLIVAPQIEHYSAVKVLFSPFTFLETFAAAILMSIIASYLPIRKIAGVDPVTVFKS
ncbi:MAG: ABC transporter permease [Patescibacteria group bacterium]|nr:ABC transporter permease [Patescibacteria group bacterium]